MEIKTIIVLMCLGCGIVGFILSILSFKINSKITSLILLIFSLIILILSNIFMFKTLLTKEETIKAEAKSINVNIGHTNNNPTKVENNGALDGLVKIKEERNKQSVGH